MGWILENWQVLVELAVALIGVLLATAWGKRNKAALVKVADKLERVSAIGGSAKDVKAGLKLDMLLEKPSTQDAIKAAIDIVDSKKKPENKAKAALKFVGTTLLGNLLRKRIGL